MHLGGLRVQAGAVARHLSPCEAIAHVRGVIGPNCAGCHRRGGTHFVPGSAEVGAPSRPLIPRWLGSESETRTQACVAIAESAARSQPGCQSLLMELDDDDPMSCLCEQ